MYEILTEPYFIIQYLASTIYIVQKLIEPAILLLSATIITTSINYLLLYISYRKIKEMAEVVVEVDVLFTLILVLLALLLFRDLRRESHDEQVAETVQRMNASVQEVVRSLEPPDAILVGPRHLRAESRRFAETARGEMIWFNVCFTMFKSQDVFDLMLRPAIENSHVTSIQFISNEGERELWNQNLLP